MLTWQALSHKSNHRFAYHLVQRLNFLPSHFLFSHFYTGFTSEDLPSGGSGKHLIRNAKCQASLPVLRERVCVCVCVCKRERERKHASKTDMKFQAHYFGVRVFASICRGLESALTRFIHF